MKVLYLKISQNDGNWPSTIVPPQLFILENKKSVKIHRVNLNEKRN